jgi:hypothetical protein
MDVTKELLGKINHYEKRLAQLETKEVSPRRYYENTTAPISEAWALGDIVWNSDPAATEYIGWVCVSAGTPGTWKGFGQIQS